MLIADGQTADKGEGGGGEQGRGVEVALKSEGISTDRCLLPCCFLPGPTVTEYSPSVATETLSRQATFVATKDVS